MPKQSDSRRPDTVPPDPNRRDRRPVGAQWQKCSRWLREMRHPLLIAGGVVNFILLIVLLVFSYLREEPSFWMNTNAWSAWPSGMRNLVQSLYYPLLLLEFLLLSVFSGISVYLLSTRHASASTAVVILPLLWGLLFMVIVNTVYNNLENLWYGRPLHWHPYDPSPQGLLIPPELPARIAHPATLAPRGSHEA